MLTRYTVGVGAAVIGAITLIFAYLLMGCCADTPAGRHEAPTEYQLNDREAALMDVSENGEVMFRIGNDGVVEFFSIEDGRGLAAYDLKLDITRAQRVSPLVDTYALPRHGQQSAFYQSRLHCEFR